MTIPTYTQSDLEALRERCAKVVARRICNVTATSLLTTDSAKRLGLLTATAEISLALDDMRALPITTHTEEAPKPIPADDREEVALAIKHCFDTGKTRFDQITDAAIRTLISLGWKK